MPTILSLGLYSIKILTISGKIVDFQKQQSRMHCGCLISFSLNCFIKLLIRHYNSNSLKISLVAIFLSRNLVKKISINEMTTCRVMFLCIICMFLYITYILLSHVWLDIDHCLMSRFSVHFE